MYARPNLNGNTSQRIAAAAPLAVFLLVIGVCSWAGRDQLKSAIEASGSFVAAQFGQSKPSQPKGQSNPAVVLGPRTVLKDFNPNKSDPDTAASDSLAKPDGGKPTDIPGEGAGPRVIVEIDDKGRKMQILDLPIPADCHPKQNADYAGDGVVWGLGHKKASAAECCAACKEHQRSTGDKPCNVWVWCGDPSGICWTMDIHNHTTGDCWLKHQATWDNDPDLTTSNLVVNHLGKFSAEFRTEHKTAPEYVPWVSGVVPNDMWSFNGNE